MSPRLANVGSRVKIARVLIAGILFGVACGVASSSPSVYGCLSAAIVSSSVAAACSSHRWRKTFVVGSVTMASMAHGAAARDRILFAPLWSWTGSVVVSGPLPTNVNGSRAVP